MRLNFIASSKPALRPGIITPATSYQQALAVHMAMTERQACLCLGIVGMEPK